MQDAGLRVDRADWQWVFDDRLVQVADVGRLIAHLEAIEVRMAELIPDTEFWLSPLEFFRGFKRILDQVSLFLLSLAAPTLAMIVAYVMLMAALSVEQRIAEVATLHSRGAGRLQVLASFALEWAVLAAVAALIGPYVGLIAARAVGSTEGFLGFAAIAAGAGTDAGSGLPLAVTRQARGFAALASVLAVAAAVGPAAAGRSPVGGHPQAASRARHAPLVLAPLLHRRDRDRGRLLRLLQPALAVDPPGAGCHRRSRPAAVRGPGAVLPGLRPAAAEAVFRWRWRR